MDAGTNRSPVTLSFVQLSCTFQDAARQTVAALRGATGVATSGEILAVLGPSGAGKSTLMDVLALRHVSGKVSGSILVNGAPVSMYFLRHSAYVPQVRQMRMLPVQVDAGTLHARSDNLL